MKRNILKILIATLVILMGIGAVSALDAHSTDDLASSEQNDVISVDESANEISVDDAKDEIQKTDDNEDTLTAKATDENTLAATATYTSTSGNVTKTTEVKTFTIAKMKFLKKYKKYLLYKHKIPTKKSKEYKTYKKFMKTWKKAYKKFKKTAVKQAKKINKAHWKSLGSLYYTTKFKGKHLYIYYKLDCARVYNYDASLNTGWWD